MLFKVYITLLLFLIPVFSANCKDLPQAIVLIGPPASGKGHLAKIIISRYNFEHISSGDLLRTSDLSESHEKSMNAGKFVDGSLVFNLVEDRIRKQVNAGVMGFILDGYPRDLKQAKKLSSLLEKYNIVLEKAILIECNDDILFKRIKKRKKEEGRIDDNIISLKKRISLYNENSESLINYYRLQNKLAILSCKSKNLEEELIKILG